LNFDFDSEGWANVAALNDTSTDPDIAGQARGFQRVVKRTAAWIPNKGMLCGLIVIIGAELVEVADVLKLAGAVRGLPRKGPIGGGRSRRPTRKADDCGGNVLARKPVLDKEIRRRPRLRKVGYARDSRIFFIGVRERGRRVRRRGRNLNLRGRFDANGLGRV